jgi:uncharacterized protein (DUF433 family)
MLVRIMANPQGPLSSDPEVLSGTVCFTGTRVPVARLMDYLQQGERIDDFLEDFPTVSREQVAAVLEIAGEAVTQHARSA